MGRSFQIVEFKVAETDFFLDKLVETTYTTGFFEARNYLSAFLSASRSISFSIQASISDLDGFNEWYEGHQTKLRQSKIAKYFLEARNHSQKVGYYPLTGATRFRDNDGQLRTKYHFDRQQFDWTPEQDVLTACGDHFKTLLEVVFDCYQKFGLQIDPDQYFTKENLTKMNKTVEDFEEELGFPRGWTDIEGGTIDDRINAIRRESHYDGVDHILIKHLGKNRFGEKVE
jgi:hypothetical protein